MVVVVLLNFTGAFRRYSSQFNWKWFWKLRSQDRGLFRFRYCCLCKCAAYMRYFINNVRQVNWKWLTTVPFIFFLDFGRLRMSFLNLFVKHKTQCSFIRILMICGFHVDRNSQALSKLPCTSWQQKGLLQRYLQIVRYEYLLLPFSLFTFNFLAFYVSFGCVMVSWWIHL